MNNIFNKIDSFNRTFLGFNPLFALRNTHAWRRYIFLLTFGSLFFWAALGWESTWNQVGTLLQSVPPLLLGQVSLTTVQSQVTAGYGIGQHLSTAVICGFCFILLSIHLEKQGIIKSLNFFLSTSLSLFSIGVYEIIYNILYSNLQNQAWTFTFASKQGLNLAVFVSFILIGIFALIYLYSLNCKPNMGKLTIFLLSLSVLTYALWIFFPLPLTTLTVQTTAGTWTSTTLFPQTMYAINLDPTTGASHAIGTPFYIPNDTVHLVNILNKVFMSLTILSLVMIKRNKSA